MNLKLEARHSQEPVGGLSFLELMKKARVPILGATVLDLYSGGTIAFYMDSILHEAGLRRVIHVDSQKGCRDEYIERGGNQKNFIVANVLDENFSSIIRRFRIPIHGITVYDPVGLEGWQNPAICLFVGLRDILSRGGWVAMKLDQSERTNIEVAARQYDFRALFSQGPDVVFWK